jgi:hypothetical protein
MSIQIRRRLQFVMLVFDPDTEGVERLKGGHYVEISAPWDTERMDPRPRDGFNAPVHLPPQKGFWAEGVSANTISVPIIVHEGQPGTPWQELAERINLGMLATINEHAAETAAVHAKVEAREKEIDELKEEINKRKEGLKNIGEMRERTEEFARECLLKAKQAEQVMQQVIADLDVQRLLGIIKAKEDMISAKNREIEALKMANAAGVALVREVSQGT